MTDLQPPPQLYVLILLSCVFKLNTFVLFLHLTITCFSKFSLNATWSRKLTLICHSSSGEMRKRNLFTSESAMTSLETNTLNTQ